MELDKTSHPWLTERSEHLVAEKAAAFGTPLFEHKRQTCSEGLHQEYIKHRNRTKDKLQQIPRSSKRCWKLSQSLLSSSSTTSSIPALQSGSGEWVLQPEGKAQLFADVLTGKAALLPITENEYSPIPPSDSSMKMSGFYPATACQTYIAKAEGK